MSGHRFVAASAAAGVVAALACSPNTGSTVGSHAGNGVSSSGGAGSSGDAGSSAAAGPGNGVGTGSTPGDGLIGGDLTRDSGRAGSDASCAALVLAPEAVKVTKVVPVEISCTSEAPQPIAIYLMLDNSGSMKDNNKWTDATAAITTFVQSDPTLSGKPWTCVDKDGNSVAPPSSLAPPGQGSISVAIQYFHPENVGGNPNECDGTGHSTPAVPMGPIPANGGNITSSLAATGPNSDTPTVGALTGGTQYCAAYQLANPDKKCALVLVTDGQPNACGLSSNCPGGGGNDCVDPASAGVLTPIAGNAFTSATNSVTTFTVGMNGVNAAGFDLLNQIAIAGGSDCTPGTPGNETCNVTTGGSQGFLDALNTIRKTVQVTSTSSQNITTTVTQTSTLSCQWTIPQPPPGQTFNKDLVNVTFTTGGTTEHLGNVPTQAECAAASSGWYYDDANAPTKILTCPDTCTAIQAATDARVSVLVGCATEPAIVR